MTTLKGASFGYTAIALIASLAANPASSAGAPPAGPGETHVPYEMEVFDIKSQVQSPGVHLAAPGDTYRYTYVINDEFAGNPEYKLERALFGVHILDPDFNKADGDSKPEWGTILIDGATATTVGKSGFKTDLLEIKSDPEIASGLPPYIFSVADQILDDGKMVLEVTNLNQKGGTDMSAEYGDFNVLRAGLHLYYSKVGK